MWACMLCGCMHALLCFAYVCIRMHACAACMYASMLITCNYACMHVRMYTRTYVCMYVGRQADRHTGKLAGR